MMAKHEIIKCDSGLENLRFGIVKQAIMDYNTALKWLRAHPGVSHDDKDYLYMHYLKTDCEVFFRSRWFSELCDLDGEELLSTIRKKYYNTPIRWGKEGGA